VRRAFHTLKGSSRMVGFKTVGEAAWGVEQCFNLWLAQERPANGDLLELADGAQRVIRSWIEAISVDPDAGRSDAAGASRPARARRRCVRIRGRTSRRVDRPKV
jgi:chemosensory pili system protein ChpA (sensor histidine kinase/response regulator)